jgi:hypothetical protein
MKTLALLIAFSLCSCTFQSPRRDKKSYVKVYQIICEHPKKGFVTYNIKKRPRHVKPYKLESSIWMFKDIRGVFVQTTFRCYTDSSMTGYVKK